MNQKWNLQDIRPASNHSRKPIHQADTRKTAKTSEAAVDLEVVSIQNGKKKKARTTFLVAVALFFVIVGTVFMSYAMRGVDLEIYPRVQQPNLNATIIAYPEARPNELAYELLVLHKEAERQVAASGEVEENTFASGRIEIFNENTSPQQLVANTRFAAPNGNIYRIAEGITIPAAAESNGDTLPGSITATVTADEVGAEYNINETVRFTIPGFAEAGLDQLFGAVYAENVETLTGGFSGTRLQIQDSERQTARQELQIKLRDELRSLIDTERPANFIYYPESITFSFEALPPIEYGQDMATLRERATLYVPLFNQDEFASYLAEATITGYQGESVRLDNYKDIRFNYTAINTNTALLDEESIEFTLTGRPLLVWNVDHDELRDVMADQHKDSLRLILAEFPAIDKGEARIQPFWQRTFPGNGELINITEILDQ